MPVTGAEWNKGKFQDVRYLVEQTDKLFRDKIIPQGGPDQYEAAVERIIQHRQWEPSRMLFGQNLLPVLRELGIFFVPKMLQPGPGFIFPRYDTTGAPVRATLRPFNWDLVLSGGIAKYGQLGQKFDFRGPNWIGNSDRVLGDLMRERVAVLVEGPFDVLACRVLMPGVPTLTSGTKTLNKMHFTYLRLLGVDRLFFMFDHERGKHGSDDGAGLVAARGMSRMATAMGFRVEIVRGVKEDPSYCLKHFDDAFRLKKLLTSFLD